MHSYMDLGGITRTAIGALWIYTISNALFGAASMALIGTGFQPGAADENTLYQWLGLFNVAVTIVTFIIIGRWIYRASSNAHTFSDDMTIRPGWAVGWYFVPIANLVKPYQAMKEAWFASHHPGDWDPDLLPWQFAWW